MSRSATLDKFLGSPQIQRWKEASKIKKTKDVILPTLDVWNYGPCEHHETPTAQCEYRACGGHPFKHQNKTAAFSYIARKSLVGNSTGTGKTLSALLTLAVAHHHGERVRALIVVPTISVNQWKTEAQRWVPGFNITSIPAKTPLKERIDVYSKDWDILIIGYHVFTKDSKKGYLDTLEAPQVIVDDVDPVLNHGNDTFVEMQKVCNRANIVIVQNATSLATRLEQLYASTVLIGGSVVWGSLTAFRDRYVKREKVWIHTKGKDGKVTAKKTYKTIGYRNMVQFRRKFDPMSIRITYEDITDDVTVPDLMTEQVYLDMSPRQLDRYHKLQEGVRVILDNQNMPAKTKAVNALTAFTIGSQICAGTFALKTSDGGYEPDAPDASPKLDWIMDKLESDWTEEKVVVYAKFRGSIMALQNRLTNENVGWATIWGAETDPEIRKQEMDRFWTDPKCRVMIISVSGERSLNLQVSSVLVMWDLQLNPARVMQIAGRVRRVGSKHKRVFVFELLHHNSQEDRYMAALAARKALFDFVYDENNEDVPDDKLLIEKLDPEQLLRLISP